MLGGQTVQVPIHKAIFEGEKDDIGRAIRQKPFYTFWRVLSVAAEGDRIDNELRAPDELYSRMVCADYGACRFASWLLLLRSFYSYQLS